MAGGLNAKHADSNSTPTTVTSWLLLDSPTVFPYQFNATPGVLDIVVVKNFPVPVHLIVCSARIKPNLKIL